MDVEQQSGLTADPVQDFTSGEDLVAALDGPLERSRPTRTTGAASSRRAALDAERSRGRRKQVRERVVVKPAASNAAEPAPRVTKLPRAPRPARSPRFTSARRRWGFHTVVMVALTAFFGTAALPAYATSGEGSTIGNARTALAVQTLTGGDAVAQVVSRDNLGIAESPGSLTSTTNNSVSPTVQALAVQLMGAVAAGRLVGSTPNHIPEIANLAEGKVVPNCGVDYRVLQAISIALDNFNQVGVSDINRRCTGQIEGAGTESAHYAEGGGHAVDFFLLNGSPATGGDARSLQLIRILDPLVPSGTGLGQIECRPSIALDNFQPFSDTCNHVHIDFLKSSGSTLRYG